MVTALPSEIYERYVLTVFDGLYLFVPQSEVDSVEIISDIHPIRSPDGAIGWFGHGQECPVYCLSDNMQLSVDMPETREYFILLKDAEQPIGITCDEVEPIYLYQTEIEIQFLPSVMKMAHMPVHQLAHYQDKVGIVCHGAALVQYLQWLSTQWQQRNEHDD